MVIIHSLDKSFSILSHQDGPTLTDSTALTDSTVLTDSAALIDPTTVSPAYQTDPAIGNNAIEYNPERIKRIKTRLRNTMNQDRLNSLAILHIEKQLTSDLDIEETINLFAASKDRKLQF